MWRFGQETCLWWIRPLQVTLQHHPPVFPSSCLLFWKVHKSLNYLSVWEEVGEIRFTDWSTRLRSWWQQLPTFILYCWQESMLSSKYILSPSHIELWQHLCECHNMRSILAPSSHPSTPYHRSVFILFPCGCCCPCSLSLFTPPSPPALLLLVATPVLFAPRSLFTLPPPAAWLPATEAVSFSGLKDQCKGTWTSNIFWTQLVDKSPAWVPPQQLGQVGPSLGIAGSTGPTAYQPSKH